LLKNYSYWEKMIYQGIVLRSYFPEKQKVSVLDIQLGRINGIPQDTKMGMRLPHGSLIAYTVKQVSVNFILYDIDLIDLPLGWEFTNFLFFHQLLELCFYFLPLHAQAQEVFYLIKELYGSQDIINTPLAKKLFLYRFFSVLGIYPVDARSYSAVFFNLISHSIDSKVDESTYKIINNDLKRWLMACIHMHPYAYRLKAIDYLNTLDVHE
jgi:hypothetical protein